MEGKEKENIIRIEEALQKRNNNPKKVRRAYYSLSKAEGSVYFIS